MSHRISAKAFKGLALGFFFTGFVVATLYAESKPTIDFEDSIYAPEGSMWGAEGPLKKSLDVPKSELPTLFQTKMNSSPLQVKVPSRFSNLFMSGSAILLDRVHICIERTLVSSEVELDNLDLILSDFQKQISGSVGADTGLIFKTFLINDVLNAGSEGCDLVIQKGDWNAFPYKMLPPSFTRSESKSAQWSGQIFALFYRFDFEHLPVITVHPDIKLSFAKNITYVQISGDSAIVDGNTLLVHEIGHLFGFEHLHRADGNFLYPELTVMGLVNDERSPESLQKRFQGGKNIWMNWDLRQTSAYRNLFWKNRRAIKLANLKPVDPVLEPICVGPKQKLRVSLPLIQKDQETKVLFDFSGRKEGDLFELNPKASTPLDLILRNAVYTFTPTPLIQIAVNMNQQREMGIEFAAIEFNHLSDSLMQILIEFQAKEQIREDFILGTSLTIFPWPGAEDGRSFMDLQMREVKIVKDLRDCDF